MGGGALIVRSGTASSTGGPFQSWLGCCIPSVMSFLAFQFAIFPAVEGVPGGIGEHAAPRASTLREILPPLPVRHQAFHMAPVAPRSPDRLVGVGFRLVGQMLREVFGRRAGPRAHVICWWSR